MNTSDFSDFLEQYHLALDEPINGRPALYRSLYSRRDDVTLANPFAPFGPVSRGYGSPRPSRALRPTTSRAT